ncbi:MAG: hypothetical protein RL077_2037 [Verrucomicrobiota bacterium]|jgi:hypothetical protein
MNERMSRREALRRAGLWASAAGVWASLPKRTWAALPAPEGWSPGEERLLTIIGDTLLPATAGSPGAGAVEIGRFIAMMASTCSPPETVSLIQSGLREIEALSQAEFARGFIDLAAAQRETLLINYEKKGASLAPAKGPHPLRPIKQWAVLGYFTSEPGATQALRYDPIPGGYRGTVPLAPGDRTWAT